VKIAGLPYGKRSGTKLHAVPLDTLHWFGVTPPPGTVADLGSEDHLLCYADRRLLFRPRPGVRARVSVLVSEPRGIDPRTHRALRFLWWRYFRVFTFDPVLLEKLPNACFLPYGTSWVDPNGTFDRTKSRHMSLIASDKRVLEGHQLRHTIADWTRTEGLEVDLLGFAYRRIDTKDEGLAPYRFSIVIENERRESYFTEKLIDAFFCDTIPIYWGAPNIGRFFDTRGMIVCESEAELKRAVASVGEADYLRCAEFLPANQTAALEYWGYEGRAVEQLRREA
jgi:hypothetical protein